MSINYHHTERISSKITIGEGSRVSNDESESRRAGQGLTQSANRPKSRERYGEMGLPVREHHGAVEARITAIRRMKPALYAGLQPVKTGVMAQ